MFRLPSWISETRSEKADAPALDMADPTLPERSPCSSPAVIKRKRDLELTAEPESHQGDCHEPKRNKSASIAIPDDLEGLGRVAEHPTTTTTTSIKSPPADYQVAEAVGSELSLEILLKHDELRLINQELAKCQIALEQMRRCHLIPYPALDGTLGAMFNVSQGTGPALAPTPHGRPVPAWAAPYGVTDGPYTRHYAKWLLEDPAFDGVPTGPSRRAPVAGAAPLTFEPRATRHAFVEGSLATKVRSQRGATGQRLQALSNGYPPAVKEKAGPCLIRRAEDGLMVKLVCLNCNRDNFSSTQGFINHCRIAHHREFKSHEAAAKESGQPVELDEAGRIVGEEAAATETEGLTHVHPLVRSAPTDKDAYMSLHSRIADSINLFKLGKLPRVTKIPTAASKTLVPAASTPHLSELMKQKGLGGDLQQLVTGAKVTFNMEDLSDDDEEEEGPEPVANMDGPNSPPIRRRPAKQAMLPASLGRPVSSKGPDSKHPRPRASYNVPPAINTSLAAPNAASNLASDSPISLPEIDLDCPMLDHDDEHDHNVDLSPNTVASNNAPSLVSDDGEYDDGSDDEDGHGTSSGVEDDSDVAEIDIEDGNADGVDKVVPRAVMGRRAAGVGKRDEKPAHVTFVSPVKESTEDCRGRR